MVGRPMMNASTMRKLPMNRSTPKYISRWDEKLCMVCTPSLMPVVTAVPTPFTPEMVAEPAIVRPVDVALMPRCISPVASVAAFCISLVRRVAPDMTPDAICVDRPSTPVVTLFNAPVNELLAPCGIPTSRRS
eukprot:1179283-Prorocentrum_minimum.AAC.4